MQEHKNLIKKKKKKIILSHEEYRNEKLLELVNLSKEDDRTRKL